MPALHPPSIPPSLHPTFHVHPRCCVPSISFKIVDHRRRTDSISPNTEHGGERRGWSEAHKGDDGEEGGSDDESWHHISEAVLGSTRVPVLGLEVFEDELAVELEAGGELDDCRDVCHHHTPGGVGDGEKKVGWTGEKNRGVQEEKTI